MKCVPQPRRHSFPQGLSPNSRRLGLRRSRERTGEAELPWAAGGSRRLREQQSQGHQSSTHVFPVASKQGQEWCRTSCAVWVRGFQSPLGRPVTQAAYPRPGERPRQAVADPSVPCLHYWHPHPRARKPLGVLCPSSGCSLLATTNCHSKLLEKKNQTPNIDAPDSLSPTDCLVCVTRRIF